MDNPIGICKWTEDDDGVWDTDCGGRFEISTGTPIENEMLFCAYCGKSLKEIRYTEIRYPDD